ncbi:MAG: DMT family transporter [Hyphomicrobiales bacterium]|nr:DMT family transporter [Hyphomicrobiales bacterium]MCP5370903.1 DMT family transporter [Hyphomicrobiales bacterium]
MSDRPPTEPPPRDGGTAHPYLLLVLTVLFWAGNVIAGRFMADTAPPITLAFCRWSLALVLVLPFGLAHLRDTARRLAPHRRLVAVLGLLGVTGFNTFLYAGLNHTTAINATVVGTATPAVIPLIAWIVHRTPVRAGQAWGIGLVTLGVFAVILQGDPAAITHLRFNLGDLLVLCSVLVWATYSVLLVFLPPGINPLAFLSAVFAVGWVGLLPLVAWDWSQGHRLPVTAATLSAIGFTAVFPSILSFLFWMRAVARVGPTTAGFFMNLVPVFTALLAVALLGETLHLYHLAGLAFVFAGIRLATRVRGDPA